MLELLCIYAIRKANRAAAQANTVVPAQPIAQPVTVERETYPPCTREGCKLRFNHAHI